MSGGEQLEHHFWTKTLLLFSYHPSTHIGPQTRGVYCTNKPPCPLCRISDTTNARRTSIRPTCLSTVSSRSLSSAPLRYTARHCTSYNAGFAVACTAQALGIFCTIFLPHGVDLQAHAFLHSVVQASLLPASSTSKYCARQGHRADAARRVRGVVPSRALISEGSGGIHTLVGVLCFLMCWCPRMKVMVNDRRDTDSAPARNQARRDVLKRRRWAVSLRVAVT